MRKLLLLILIGTSVAGTCSQTVMAQTAVPSAYDVQLITYNGAPPNNGCSVYQEALDVTTGNFYNCNPATKSWRSIGLGSLAAPGPIGSTTPSTVAFSPNHVSTIFDATTPITVSNSLIFPGSAPAITATGTTPYINASGPLIQTQQCSFSLTTSTLTLALSPVNLCTITLPNAAVVWRVNCQGGWSVPAGTNPTFAVGNNWAQTPSGVFGAANIDTTNAGVGVEGTTSSTANGSILATGPLTPSATIFTTTWWTTFTGSATSGQYHPTASLTGVGATGTLVGFCTIQ